MQNIRISDINVGGTSNNLRHADTGNWWKVIRPVLEAKAVVDLHRAFAEKRRKQDTQDGLQRIIDKAQKKAAA